MVRRRKMPMPQRRTSRQAAQLILTWALWREKGKRQEAALLAEELDRRGISHRDALIGAMWVVEAIMGSLSRDSKYDAERYVRNVSLQLATRQDG